jgi:hypothetical protein
MGERHIFKSEKYLSKIKTFINHSIEKKGAPDLSLGGKSQGRAGGYHEKPA